MSALPLRRLKPLPISRDEFARFFRKCAPPTGWPNKIAVGNSGGSDSTCLLFLIHRYLQDIKGQEIESADPPPSDMVSLTVDHGLQASSDAMAQHCADLAKSLGVKHITSKIPWSEPPFPDLPKAGEAFEAIGRNVRYQVLFNAMGKSQANVLALGHHGDDQVETSLIRLAMGTTELGAGGMRRCRRWGMGANGDEHTLGWSGVDGMRRWIVRPLLEVSKDRILVTCDENKLEYVTDITNFQPQLTLRNAIRHLLAKGTLDPQAIDSYLPPDITQKLDNIKYGMASLESVDMDPSEGLDNLRAAVTVLSEQVEDIDSLVDTSLNRSHLPSPAGTYMVSCRGLSTVRDPLVQKALVLRIMRYVSFHAWGTVRADGNRRKTSLARITENLWVKDPIADRISPFVAGGGVFWTPVIVGGAYMRFPTADGRLTVGQGEISAWLAARQPPLSQQRMADQNMVNPLRLDITEKVREKLQTRHENPGQILDVLWDCRFLLQMDIDKIPDDVAQAILDGGARLLVHPNTRWYWPKVLIQTPNPHSKDNPISAHILHSSLSIPHQRIIKLDRDTMESWPFVRIPYVTAPWIRTEWIRSLAAL
ncbi:PP-loop family-domain-containing protein [Mycena epipterygia]|nr:PP-loop family-domain-containing protein [Mycena epipterygia]